MRFFPSKADSSSTDSAGEPKNKALGYAQIETRYEGSRKRIDQFLGADGKLTSDITGVARIETTRDDKGNDLAKSLFGLDGKPILSAMGYHRIGYVHDEIGRLLDVNYYDVAESPVRTQVVITGVYRFSQAERIGLLPNDVVVSYDGEEVKNTVKLAGMLLKEGGETRDLVVRRGNEVRTFRVAPGLIRAETADVVQIPSGGPAASR